MMKADRRLHLYKEYHPARKASEDHEEKNHAKAGAWSWEPTPDPHISTEYISLLLASTNNQVQ